MKPTYQIENKEDIIANIASVKKDKKGNLIYYLQEVKDAMSVFGSQCYKQALHDLPKSDLKDDS